ncbi:hypothetical protein HHI36_009924 [Cryptolaemus montrouzieri]|uniref:Uncharacterized protein n=1 Tax=Cryptolaemus montrouzieri TaxID=559131 RepID=A0ABD2MHX3_9CUCU
MELVDLIRKKEREFYRNEIGKNKAESKNMWKTFKELVNKGQKSVDFSLLDLQIQGEAIEDSFFAASIKQIVSSIPEPDQDFKEVERLESNASADEIVTSKLLKDLFPMMGYPWLNLVNTSLQTGKLPSAFKISVATSVTKVNNPKTAEELRTINKV